MSAIRSDLCFAVVYIFQDCQEQCFGNVNCILWVYDTNKSHCYFKPWDAISNRQKKNSTVSGTKRCPGDFLNCAYFCSSLHFYNFMGLFVGVTHNFLMRILVFSNKNVSKAVDWFKLQQNYAQF